MLPESEVVLFLEQIFCDPHCCDSVSIFHLRIQVADISTNTILVFLKFLNYSLRPRIQVILAFKICPIKLVIPPFGQYYGPTIDREYIHTAP